MCFVSVCVCVWQNFHVSEICFIVATRTHMRKYTRICIYTDVCVCVCVCGKDEKTRNAHKLGASPASIVYLDTNISCETCECVRESNTYKFQWPLKCQHTNVYVTPRCGLTIYTRVTGKIKHMHKNGQAHNQSKHKHRKHILHT